MIGWPEQEHFYYEIALGFLFIAYLIQYYRGKSENENIAKTWASLYLPLFKKNFATAQDSIIYRDGNSEFKYYLSGRVNCQGYYCQIDLKRRHDLFYVLYDFFFGNSSDTLTIDVPLEKMEPFIFAIASTKYKEEMFDINNYVTNKMEHLELRPNVIWTDSPELVSYLLSDEIIKILKSRDFLSLHFSDQSEFYSDKCLRFVFRIPSELERLKSLMQMTMLMIDLVQSIELKDKSKNELAREKAKVSSQQKKNREKELEEARKRKKEKDEKKKK